MLEIDIKTIPHNKQRYDTVGDYWVTPDGKIKLRVSDLKNWRYEFLIALHEMVELGICRYRGIAFSEIDEFDKAYEAARKDGDLSEPGNDPKAPYFAEHQFATMIEMFMAQKLGVSWEEYNKVVEEL